MDDATQSKLLQSLLAPILQPQAQLGLTGQETQTSAQSAATSGQEQQNLQASNPGIQAQSSTQQIENLQKKAQLGLSNDLTQNKMTLPSAIKKYTALGMKADDVFKQYLAESPWGLPNQSPTQLQNMGVSPDAIGKIGDNGSFADRWNTKQAVLGMRDLHNKWNTVNPLSKIGVFGLGPSTPSSQGYDAQRQFLGQHLSSLVPGSPGGQGPAGDLMSQIPDVNHITETEPGAADQRFNGAEQGLLNVKGYSYKDLGLAPQGQQQQNANIKQRPNMKGGELLQNIMNDAKGDVKGAVNTGSEFVNKILSGENPSTATGDMAIEQGKSYIGQLANLAGIQYKNGKLSENPNEILQQITQHPLNSALTVLPFLSGLKGEPATTGETAGETPKATPKSNTPSASTKPMTPNDLITKLMPSKSRDAGFALKSNAIKAIDSQKNGGVNADNIATTVQQQIPTLKKAFSGVTNKDVEEVLQGVADDFKGKMKGAEAEKIYNTIPDSFTATGHAKQDFNSAVNLIKKKAISDEIENTAPGAGWKEGIQAQAKAFKAEKGQPAKIVKNLPYNFTRAAVNGGMNAVGLGFLRDIIGG